MQYWDNYTKSALLAVLAMTLISSNDAILKFHSHLGLGQLLFVRGVFAILVFSLIIYCSRQQVFSRQLLSKWNLIRAFCECGAALLFVYSLSLLPLAIATTLGWTAPILLTLSSAVVYKEKVGLIRWCAVAIGFAGVLFVTRPFGSDFQWSMLLPLGAAFCVLFRDLATKKVDSSIPSHIVVLTTLAVVALTGGTMSLHIWHEIDTNTLIWIAFSSVLLSLGFYCNISAIRRVSLSFVAPFLFSSIIVATLWGYVFLNETPSFLTLLGMALVITAGIMTLKTHKTGQ